MADAIDRWSWLPWRRQRMWKDAIDSEILELVKTASAIRADHGLDQLVIDIEEFRSRGEHAMNRVSDDQEKKRTSHPGHQQST